MCLDFIIKHYNELDSTQLEAKRMLDNGLCNVNTVIFTQNQLNGFGKRSRIWSSEKGDIALTIILCPKKQNFLQQICFIGAVAVGVSILEINKSLSLQYKWPNDVYINEKKISGILLEQYKENFLLVGIGINVIKQNIINSISLTECNIDIALEEFIEKLLCNFSTLYQKWIDYGFLPIRHLLLERLYGVGRIVHLKNNVESATRGVIYICNLLMNMEMQLYKINLVI